MSEDITYRRNELFKSLEIQITNIITHISANTLREEDFATLSRIIETFYLLEDFMKKVYGIKDNDFKMEKQYLRLLNGENTNMRSLWKSNTSIETVSIIRIRSYTRGLKDAVRRIHEIVNR